MKPPPLLRTSTISPSLRIWPKYHLTNSRIPSSPMSGMWM